MITKNNLPIGYLAYPVITLCSNKIVGGSYLFAIGDILPLLIGKGPKPTIWLQAIAKPNSQSFITVVDASIATHPVIAVTEKSNKVIVSAGGVQVLIVEAVSSEEAVVSELDLRPIGLNIYGNESKLFVSGMQVSSSTFSGVGTAFGFGQ